MDEATFENYKKAGKIAGEARDFGVSLIKEGVSLLETAESVERFIKRKGAKVAFPVNIAINNVAAHYTPTLKHKKVFEKGDVVKLDVGAHVNGCIGDTAFTIEVGTQNWNDLIKASREALNVVIELIRPGVDLMKVGEIVETTIHSFGFKPISNLTGHNLEPYTLHAGLSVPNVRQRISGKVKIGTVLAIEPFATDGAGRVDGKKNSSIYRLERDRRAKTHNALLLLQFIKENYRTLPFAERWCVNDFGAELGRVSKTIGAIKQLTNQSIIKPYPILIEVKNGIVSQAEHTVIVTEDGCEVITL